MAVLRGRDANVVDDPARGNGRGLPPAAAGKGCRESAGIFPQSHSPAAMGGIPWPCFADVTRMLSMTPLAETAAGFHPD